MPLIYTFTHVQIYMNQTDLNQPKNDTCNTLMTAANVCNAVAVTIHDS